MQPRYQVTNSRDFCYIDNVVQAHIHCGRFGENGPIRIWLFPTIGTSGSALTGPTGSQDGVLAEGTFDPTGVVCPAANVGTAMPVLDAMRNGLAYVNVHTNDGVAPTNTGPGDFPGGEIRGQVPRIDPLFSDGFDDAIQARTR